MPHNPATLAADFVRIPSSTYRKGIKYYLDHVNEEFKIIDETEEHFPFINLPKILSPELWVSKEVVGWKLVGDELHGFVNGNVFAKISETTIRFYDDDGTKKLHFDRASGNLYISGGWHSNGINMPAD